MKHPAQRRQAPYLSPQKWSELARYKRLWLRGICDEVLVACDSLYWRAPHALRLPRSQAINPRKQTSAKQYCRDASQNYTRVP